MSTQKTLKEFLVFRLKNHKRDCVFWMFLVFIVCGIGAAGIWATVVPAIVAWDADLFRIADASSALYTFFPALLVTSCAELVLPDNICKPARMLSVVLIIVALLLMILCANLCDKAALIVGLVGCLLAVIMWVVAHGEDQALSDGFSQVNASTGGDDGKPVAGSEGEYEL